MGIAGADVERRAAHLFYSTVHVIYRYCWVFNVNVEETGCRGARKNRSAITTTIPDSKCKGIGSLAPGESLYIPCLPHSINLNSEADTKEEWHTVQATYTIRVNDGNANRTDTHQVNLTYGFKHE